jgi:hypothetical protein
MGGNNNDCIFGCDFQLAANDLDTSWAVNPYSCHKTQAIAELATRRCVKYDAIFNDLNGIEKLVDFPINVAHTGQAESETDLLV